MADVVEVQLDDVQEFSFAGDTYKGVTSVRVTVRQGRLMPVRYEGEMIGSAVEREADSQRFPVEFQLQSNSAATEVELAQIAEKGAITFTARERGAATPARNEYTIADALIGEGAGGANTNFREGNHTVSGVGASFADTTGAV